MKNRFVAILTLLAFCGGWLGCLPGTASAAANFDAARVDRYVQAQMKKNNIPGLAVAIVHGDQTVYAKGFGKDGDGSPVTPRTPFAIASLSKSVTALAVMQLVEVGKLDLDAPVTEYIPSFKTGDPRAAQITVRMLLNQTSGLADSVFPEMTFREQPKSLEESVARFGRVKLASAPGRQFHYHNPNYQILARLAEVASGEKFPDYLSKHIFRPLHMDRTTDVADTKLLPKTFDPFADGHILVYGKPIAMKEPDWFVEGAAGNVSTAEDMARWLSLQLDGGEYDGVRLLSADGIRTMHTVPAGLDSTYGMGWTIEGDKIEHNGLLWTYYADQTLLPESGYGIVVLFNTGLNMLVPYSSFMQGIIDILDGKQPKGTFFADRTNETIVGVLTLLTAGSGIFRLARMKRWEVRTRKRAKWLTWTLLISNLIPLLLLIFLPRIVAFIAAGRQLSRERLFLTLPSVSILLMLAAGFGAAVAIGRAICLYRSPARIRTGRGKFF
ncbi:serine hydrolase domain-containing protein [Cohnella zeiphila]|uniref:Beta-lactamase family protein n=1 Tax=Cohnella zeiphila TaxID=2761120 RepID=A0A7X0VX68_9BACL|nr:serine hydrolase domain-containing protein [Cohnella zeiphila]MBB6733701.1 beta-lactamase family protein [Cohnella zeiphila]